MIKKLYYWLHQKFSKPDERGEYSAGAWQNAVRTKVLELSKEAQGKFLEVGCGEGLFLCKIAKAKPELEIVGIDIWDKILSQASERLKRDRVFNVKLLQADATKLPFEDDFFDTVVCMNVFFNLPDYETFLKVLSEISRVLKPQAKLIFDIRNSRNPLLAIKYKFARYYDATVKDLSLQTYDPDRVKQALKDNKLVVQREFPIGRPKNKFAPIFVIMAGKI